MGFPGKVKFPIISNHFAKCGHKGELSAVFSPIYYLKQKKLADTSWLTGDKRKSGKSATSALIAWTMASFIASHLCRN